MANDRTVWRFSIKHPGGQSLFTVLVEREAAEDPKPSSGPPAPPAAAGNRAVVSSGAADGEPRMTDPQKRYLFRLLAQQGIEGKRAEDHLKEYFKVKSLRDVTKASASQLIEQMVADRREVRDGAA